MKLSSQLRLAFLATAATLVFVDAAWALDADAFTAKLSATYATYGYDLKFGAATVDGDTITVNGLTVSLTTMAEPMAPVAVDTVLTFSGVAETDDGGYSVATMTIPDFVVPIDKAELSIANFAFNNLHIPGAEAPTLADTMKVFENATVGPITVTEGGKTVVSIDSVWVQNTFDPAEGDDLNAVSTTAGMDGLNIDLTTIPGAEGQQAIAVLGLDQITGGMTEALDWTLGDGRLTLSDFTFTADELASFGFTLDIAGYTPALLDSLMATQKQMIDMQKSGDTEGVTKAQSALAMTMMGQLTLVGASVRYDDASLATKLIDFFAAQQNLQPEQAVAALKMAMEQNLPPTMGEALKAQVVAAVSAFLDDPQSLEVRLAPAQPLNFMVLAAAAGAPDAVIPMLGLTITANDGGAAEEAPAEDAPAEESGTKLSN